MTILVLVFKNYKGKRKVVGNPNNQSHAFQIIKKYCLENNKQVKYYRVWTKDWGNDMMITTIDFGSHSEFFYMADDKYKKELVKCDYQKKS